MAKLGTIWRGARGKFANMSIYSNSNGTFASSLSGRKVTNPNTETQRIQRAIYRTCVRAYSFYKDICDHSFQGCSGKGKNQNKFMEVNLKKLREDVAVALNDGTVNECLNFYPANYMDLMPVGVKLSKGSLPEVPVTVYEQENTNFFVAKFEAPTEYINNGYKVTYNSILKHYDLKRGDQLTFILVAATDQEGWKFIYNRRILDPRDSYGNALPMSTVFDGSKKNQRDQGDEIFFNTENNAINNVMDFYTLLQSQDPASVGGAAIIVSRPSKNGWLRSNSELVFTRESVVDGFSIVEATEVDENNIVTTDALYLNEAKNDSSTYNVGSNQAIVEGLYAGRYIPSEQTGDVVPIRLDSNKEAEITDRKFNYLKITGQQLQSGNFKFYITEDNGPESEITPTPVGSSGTSETTLIFTFDPVPYGKKLVIRTGEGGLIAKILNNYNN